MWHLLYLVLPFFILLNSFYPKTIAAAIAFPIDIPLEGVVKLNTPEPLVCNIWPLLPSAAGNVKASIVIVPVPFGCIDIPILLSSPDAVRVGLFPVAALL